VKFLLVLTVLAILLPGSASAAISEFEGGVIKTLDEIGKNAVANEAEVTQLQKSMGSYDSSQKEITCMVQLQSNFREIFRSTHLLSDLGSLASIMESKRDQIRANAFLSKELEVEKAGVDILEKSVADIQSRCNTMLIVNYSQRALNLMKLIEPEIQKLQYYLAPSLAQ
jgi:hypothetical protein